MLLFLFLNNAFCGLFLPFNFIAGSHSAMSQGRLPAKALFLSDLLKKIYLHFRVHSPRLGGLQCPGSCWLGLWCQCCVSSYAGPESYLERFTSLMSCISAPGASAVTQRCLNNRTWVLHCREGGFQLRVGKVFSSCAYPSLQSPNTAQGSREMLLGWHKEVVVSVALKHLIQTVWSRFFL